MQDVRTAYARPLWIGLGLLVAAVLLGVGVALGMGEHPFPIDEAWQEWISSVRGPVLLAVSYAMNWLGGGWFGAIGIPVIVIVILLAQRRRWGAVFYVAATVLSALLVQILKHAVGRPRPEDILVVSDFGSFPSGHTAHAATLAVALFVLFPRVVVAVAGAVWVTLMAFSRTYLGAHWLSDTLGGALVGAAAALLAAAAFAKPLAAEARQLAAAGAAGPARSAPFGDADAPPGRPPD